MWRLPGSFFAAHVGDDYGRVMRLAVVTEMAPREDEAMHRWTRSFATYLAQAGHEVEEFRPQGSPRTAVMDPRLGRALRAFAPEVIQYVPYSGLTTPSLIRLAALRRSTPGAVSCIAALQCGEPPARLLGMLRADLAICVSQRLAQVAMRVARRTVTIYPPVDFTRFHPVSPAQRLALRRRLGYEDSDRVVLHVGHLKRSRGLHVLAEIARYSQLRVVMVASEASRPDLGVKAELEAAGVMVVHRFVPVIEDFYVAADAYVFPVEDALGAIELPLSVVEALACGTPVVSTPFGHLTEIFPPVPRFLIYEPSSRIPSAVRCLLASDSTSHTRLSSLNEFEPQTFARRVETALASSRTSALIAISGIDGAGKSTQIRLLKDDLARRGCSVTSIWCRWDPFIARPLIRMLDVVSSRGVDRRRDSAQRRRTVRRRLLDNPFSRTAWRAMMVVDYALRVGPKVRRARWRHSVVLLDRYWQDVMVDYSRGKNLSRPPRLVAALLPPVTLHVILDLPAELASARAQGSPSIDDLAERQRLYAEIIATGRAVRVDAARDPAEIHAELLDVVSSVLAGHITAPSPLCGP